MKTTSLVYLLFVSAVFLLTWIFRGKGRKAVLLLSSVVFLVSFGNPVHWIYVCGIILYTWLLQKIARKLKRSWFLVLLVPYIGGLVLFKYFHFTSLVMPIGISFYTFKAISFLADIRKKRTEPVRFLDLAIYLTFFPVVSAGPINRAEPFFEQLNSPLKFQYVKQKNGAVQAAFGLFEKIVFADALSPVISLIYSDSSFTGLYVLMAIVLYSFQIYADFDGYSNIAIGVSRMLGFDLEKNFNTPYLASNIRQFWDRWHISLSSWLRDYIYIPLGGNRRGTARKCLNIMIVFLFSGFWHGGSLMFVIWGALHGILNIIEGFLMHSKESRNSLTHFIGILVNFTLVSLLWVFFRSAFLEEAVSIFQRLLITGDFQFEAIHMTVREGIWTLCIPLWILITDILRNRKDMIQWLAERPFILRWSIYILAVFVFIVFGAYGPGYHPEDFIYITF